MSESDNLGSSSATPTGAGVGVEGPTTSSEQLRGVRLVRRWETRAARQRTRPACDASRREESIFESSANSAQLLLLMYSVALFVMATVAAALTRYKWDMVTEGQACGPQQLLVQDTTVRGRSEEPTGAGSNIEWGSCCRFPLVLGGTKRGLLAKNTPPPRSACGFSSTSLASTWTALPTLSPRPFLDNIFLFLCPRMAGLSQLLMNQRL